MTNLIDAVRQLKGWAKGTLLVGDGSASPVLLTMGANGQFLSADSTQASGLKWAAGGSNVHDETLTDGNGNFIFAAGDVIVVLGVSN